MGSARWLATAAALTTAAMFTGTATAAPAGGGAASAAQTAAVAPTEPKYFLGAGYGPWNITVESAWGTAYSVAANKGYPEARCKKSAGPAGQELGPGYYQVLVEIYCVPPPSPGSGQIVGVHSGQCVDVKGAGTKDDTPIQLYHCNGGVAQAWKLHSDGTLRAMGKCMDVQYARTENGPLLGLNTCHSGLNQKWEKPPGGLPRSVHSGRCLDALDWGTGNGTRLGIWDCTPHHTDQQGQGPGLST
ncbi:ricin-type beta-trefoil lectin domain protein [Streptomyces sp. GDS52]|uniref:ricin-type beta-trefoil lectin domain protein n=1 Tax=Streptomyces sp. GDS52 TaxID=3406419 RepID=UPI003FCFAFCA